MVCGWGADVTTQPDPPLPPHSPHPCQVRTNVPSWCDRILWKSYPETHVNCNAYGELRVPISPQDTVFPLGHCGPHPT